MQVKAGWEGSLALAERRGWEDSCPSAHEDNEHKETPGSGSGLRSGPVRLHPGRVLDPRAGGVCGSEEGGQ